MKVTMTCYFSFVRLAIIRENKTSSIAKGNASCPSTCVEKGTPMGKNGASLVGQW